MSNQGEPELSKDVEQFLMEKEVLWNLESDLPKRLAEFNMPLNGQSIVFRPNDIGNGYSIILFTVPGEGCQFCGLKEAVILKFHHLAPKKWLNRFDSAVSDIKLRLCPNCYAVLHSRMNERFNCPPTGQEFGIFLFGYSYERTNQALSQAAN